MAHLLMSLTPSLEGDFLEGRLVGMRCHFRRHCVAMPAPSQITTMQACLFTGLCTAMVENLPLGTWLFPRAGGARLYTFVLAVLAGIRHEATFLVFSRASMSVAVLCPAKRNLMVVGGPGPYGTPASLSHSSKRKRGRLFCLVGS